MSDYDPVYMRKDVLAFLRQWPNYEIGPTGEEHPAHKLFSLMHSARMVCNMVPDMPTKDRYLSRLGNVWKNVVDSQSINFFSLETVLDLWPVDLLTTYRPDIEHYLRLFGLDFKNPDVKSYLAKGMQKAYVNSTTGTFGALQAREWLEANGIVLPLGDLTRRSLAGHRGFLESLADLGEALWENAGARRLESWRIDPSLEAEIPF